MKLSRAMRDALNRAADGRSVRGFMASKLYSLGLVTIEREAKLSGAGGMPSVSYTDRVTSITPRGARARASAE